MPKLVLGMQMCLRLSELNHPFWEEGGRKGEKKKKKKKYDTERTLGECEMRAWRPSSRTLPAAELALGPGARRWLDGEQWGRGWGPRGTPACGVQGGPVGESTGSTSAPVAVRDPLGSPVAVSGACPTPFAVRDWGGGTPVPRCPCSPGLWGTNRCAPSCHRMVLSSGSRMKLSQCSWLLPRLMEKRGASRRGG